MSSPVPELTATAVTPGPGEGRVRLDLVIVGLLVVAALLLRLHLMRSVAPAPLHALGPDFDDWEGVFHGARHSWPPAWDHEWNRRYPLLPVLAVALSRASGLPMAAAAQWVCTLLGSLLPGCTYAIGLRSVGRPAALVAAGWMVLQDGLTTFHLLSSGYGLVPVFFATMLLGTICERRGRWVGRGLVVVSAALLTLAILQGALHALVLMVLAAMAYGVRDRRQPGRWLRLLGGLWPALLGVGLGIAALARFAVGGESPLWGALRSILIDLNATLLQRGHLGPPTGHKVHRLLAGTPRSEHFLATVQEQLGLPAVVLGLLLLAGVWTLVKAPSARPRAAGWLLLLLSGLCLYGLVANTEDFHSAQWFPPMALVASAGLLGWTRVLPGRMLRAGIPVCLTVGLWAALLWLPSLHPQPRDQLYGRLSLHAGMSRQWAALSDQAVGPVSAGGTLLVDDADVWAHRGFLLGRASLADLHRFHDGVGGVQHLEQPLVLLSGRGPSAVKQRLAGTWEYRPIDSFVDPRPLWLYLVVPHQIASSTPSTPSTTATP